MRLDVPFEDLDKKEGRDRDRRRSRSRRRDRERRREKDDLDNSGTLFKRNILLLGQRNCSRIGKFGKGAFLRAIIFVLMH